MPIPPGRIPSPASDHAPTDPLAAVRGRVLLHVKGTKNAPLDHIDPRSGGVVFSGQDAAKRLADFVTVQGRDDCPMVLDPSAYERHFATVAEPFALREPTLFHDEGLQGTLEQWEECTADLVLTPTRYLDVGENGARALEEAVSQINATDTSRVAFAVPVDARWLTQRLDELVSLLRRVRIPKALILGSKDKPASSKQNAQALRRIFSEVEETALLRIDLAAVDAMVHGASFASIGDTASTRRAFPPGERSFNPDPSDTSPNVLVPDLLGYFRGSTLADHLRADSLRCSCPPCADSGENEGAGRVGRSLVQLQDSADTPRAHAHNLAVWSGLWWELSGSHVPACRSRWREKCACALQNHEEYSRRVSPVRDKFRPSKALEYWAQPHH